MRWTENPEISVRLRGDPLYRIIKYWSRQRVRPKEKSFVSLLRKKETEFPIDFPHVAELVDAPDLGSGVRKDVQVRVLSRGLTNGELK